MSNDYDYLARELSIQQWEFLADHFEGKRPVASRALDWNGDRTRQALLVRKLVRVEPPPNVTTRPTHTVLTERGHAVMCAALGMMADMLTKNGFDGIRNPKPKDDQPKERFGYGKIAQGPTDPADGGNPVYDPQSRSG